MAVLRSDGRWMARKQVGGQRHVAYGATETEAEQNLAELLAPVPVLLKSPTLHHFVESYWIPQVAKLEPKTLQRYLGVYRAHIQNHLGPLPLITLSGRVVRQYMDELERRGASDYTIRYTVGVLGNICRLALSYDLLAKNPIDGVKRPKRVAKRHRAIEPAKAREVLDGLAGTDLAAPVFLALTLGLRQGEIAGLMWDDLDRQRGELRIQRQLQEQSGRGVVVKALKTESSKRTLFLPKWIVAEIDRLGNLDSPYICTHNGHRWNPTTLWEHWRRVRNQFGLGDWTFHDLRHGAAGLLYAAGCDYVEIAAVLGHAKADMSALYTSLTEERARQAIAKLSGRDSS